MFQKAEFTLRFYDCTLRFSRIHSPIPLILPILRLYLKILENSLSDSSDCTLNKGPDYKTTFGLAKPSFTSPQTLSCQHQVKFPVPLCSAQCSQWKERYLSVLYCSVLLEIYTKNRVRNSFQDDRCWKKANTGK